jgi:hypothetical protein
VKASSDKFAIGEIANIVPALRGYENLQPAFEINASGPPTSRRPAERAREDCRSGGGNLIVDSLGPQRLSPARCRRSTSTPVRSSAVPCSRPTSPGTRR